MLGLKIKYSPEVEGKLVASTINRVPWYDEQGYKYTLPYGLNELVENKDKIDPDIVKAEISREYDEKLYKDVEEEIIYDWQKVEERVNKMLTGLSGIQKLNEVKVILTRYGVGGRYHLPDQVYINIALRRKDGKIVGTIVHEIVHLLIQDLIVSNNIEHWTKERIVDLIVTRNFEEYSRLQRDPENAKDISKIFNEYYPDIDTIISRVGSMYKG